MKNKLLPVAALGILLLSSTANADEATKQQIALLQQQVKQLQEQLNLLQRKQEVAEEITVSNQEKFANVELGNKGLSITSPDKKYQFRIRGYGQADSRTYIDDDSNNLDQFLIRSARPVLEAKFPSDLSARLQFDFASGNTRVVDAYADWKGSDYATLRLGKFKVPVGLERWQGETETLFVERGLPTNLVPFRDIGIGVQGEIIPQTLEYMVALTDGIADGGDTNTDIDGGKDFSAKIFAHPFKNTDLNYLQGLGIGIAGSAGQRDGTTTSTGLSSGLKTTGQNNFYTYTANTFANGKATRINPQLWYYNGPFSFLAEHVTSENRVTNGGTTAELTNTAWTTIATYVLTGEDASFDGVKPREDFAPEKNKWGAWEVTARFGKLDVDDASFPVFGNPATSARSIEEKIIGLNWYLNQNIKFNFNLVHDTFEGGAAAGGDRPDEKAVLARVQFKF